ncbi:SagB/ThcOx family dehydrogenase [Azorhizobium doebereinerae]|uniref:SagB/ThcOx family dehydrogenase n=1 Tax=Azorhizobium doebereinerae TaxID=281091 RepID=UPI0004239C25|nr:SagB/ThcOx family dehydrogenase [Azorhizobium doebereinerae]
MTSASAKPAVTGDSSAVVLAYHARTKHTLKRYAAGPETLDWDLQPNPFREFSGCPRTPLEPAAEGLATRFGEAIMPGGVSAAPLTLPSVGLLLELSLGLAAWKELGPDRWAVRCNPSSGNLHPTEAYVIARGVAGLDDGVHHYLSRDHVLEHRCLGATPEGATPGLWIGLSSVHWREAWKYGERAFRYCQLDLGHALGALRYAAGAIGWRVRMVEGLDSAALAALMGLDRTEDFAGVEAEEADVLLAVDTGPGRAPPAAPPMPAGPWTGRANRLDAHPMYRWPVIDEVSAATRSLGLPANPPLAEAALAPPPERDARAADILLGRRSAQRFDARYHMPAETFFALAEALLPRASVPWDVWNYRPRLHPVLFVHRVEGLAPGLYALPRHPAALGDLKAALRTDFAWAPVANAPAHLPLHRLVESDARGVMRTVSCHQAIAGDSCFALSLLAEFAPRVSADPWRYRQLHWEAGLIGHVLYLEAERAGLRGTGIGCFFDDALHDLLGVEGDRFQSLYHFTVGRALTDARISTLPAYPGRRPPPGASPSLSEDQTP